MNSTIMNVKMDISPVTLDPKMSKEAKLGIHIPLALLGGFLNLCHMICIASYDYIRLAGAVKNLAGAKRLSRFGKISAMAQRRCRLKLEGILFMFYMTFCDSLIPFGVIPLTLSAVFSNKYDTVKICHAQYFIATVSVYGYSLLTAAHAFEFSLKTKFSTNVFGHGARISIISFSLLGFSCALSALGVYVGLDYDYCEQKHEGDYMFRYASSIGFIILPMLASFIYLIKGFIRAREKIQLTRKNFPGHQKTGKRHYFIIADENVTPLVNLLAYLFYLIMWLPYVIRIHLYPKGEPHVFINLAVLGLSRSVFAPCLYWTDQQFGTAYGIIYKGIKDRMNCRKEYVNSDEDLKKHYRAPVNFRLSRLNLEAGDPNDHTGSEIQLINPL